jgi:peptidoglycan-N-acetylglucosamine deacetylase
VPAYSEMLETAERWRRLPALERLEAGAALTFDDGPDPDGTPAVLDALDEVGVKATFFVVGEQLMRHHALARETLARGHELGLHCFEHVHYDQLPGTFEAACGRRARFFRPPYGRFDDHAYEACADLGLEPVYWSAWGLDWETLTAERIADLVGRDLSDGTIVLLHDSARYGHRPDASTTAAAIAPIVARATELGLSFAPIGKSHPK